MLFDSAFALVGRLVGAEVEVHQVVHAPHQLIETSVDIVEAGVDAFQSRIQLDLYPRKPLTKVDPP